MSYRQSVVDEFAAEFDVDRLYIGMTFIALFGIVGVLAMWMLNDAGAEPHAGTTVANAVNAMMVIWFCLAANLDKLLAISVKRYLYKPDTNRGESA